LIGFDGMKAPDFKKPGAFLWLIRLRQFGVRGIALFVFGEQLLA
jgi:hypothetical protein